MKDKPLIAITMGDPAGVGPEVVVKALNHKLVQARARCLVIGDQMVLEDAAAALRTSLDLEILNERADINVVKKRLLFLSIPPSGGFPVGRVDARCGQASVNYILAAIDLALSHQVSAIATAPINKAALQAAGIPFKGHTEILAEKTGSQDVAMMLVTPGRGKDPQWLRVTHATTHIPLKDVPASLSIDRILKTVEATQRGLNGLGIGSPRLALAALNPHASDEGLMGDEEEQILLPAVAAAQHQGYDIAGPIPADTVFLRAMNGEFDAVIALYHDQGHIPVKTHGFERAVNITLGLPIIRTSVDHGTAFDIAWKNQADEASMVEAILLAAAIAVHQ